MRKEKPSRTALKVALNMVTLSAKQGMDECFPPGTVEATEKLLAAAGLVSQRTLRWCRSRWMVSLYESFDWMLPGQFEAFALRKAFCEKQVRAGIQKGARQILVLGAGYDTMAWRLAPEFPEVRFFEIDHPATARIKIKGIEAMGRRENLYLIAEDLGKQRLTDVLAVGQWDGYAQTVVVAEGLVMYLSPDAVEGLFLQCAEVTGSGSRMAFSYIPAGADGRPDAGPWTGLMLWLQKAGGEPWRFSITPEDLGPFLEETGWTIAPAMFESIRKYGVEFYAVAERNETGKVR